MLQARGAERIACGEERAMALLIVEGCTSWGGVNERGDKVRYPVLPEYAYRAGEAAGGRPGGRAAKMEALT